MSTPALQPELMLVPGGTSALAITRTYSAVHKLWEFFEREEATGQKRGKWIVVAPRPLQECFPPTLAASTEALVARLERLPAEVDVIVETSGSATGKPRLVGLSYAALVASARATHKALGGPGRWIVALPVHHIAGLMTLVRCCVAEASPIIAEFDNGFDPEALIRACRSMFSGGGVRTDLRSYLAVVPKQLADALEAGGELVDYLRRLDAILVGGAQVPRRLLEQARTAGLTVYTTYGMTETSGGVVYNGIPLDGVEVTTDSSGCALIHSPSLLVDYLDGPVGADFVWQGNRKFLRTSDRILSEGGKIQVLGRADDVIISGGLNVSPAAVTDALLEATELKQAVVVGVSDPTWGELVAAVVVATSVEAAPQWRDQVGAILGRQFAPRVFLAVSEIPVKDIGKPDRSALVNLISQQLRLPAKQRSNNFWVKTVAKEAL